MEELFEQLKTKVPQKFKKIISNYNTVNMEIFLNFCGTS